ncbi:MAG: hypothetical protein BAJALOKI2v1_210037 [Promethearchaeota archaeon]|nr:MAG: hypothetical protein BAJALOKI2v1_210037 [Candidatus Lokiarchaeota archaeon]
MISQLKKKKTKNNRNIICYICGKPIKFNLAIYYVKAQPVFVCNECHLKLPSRIREFSMFKMIENQ